MNVQAIEIASLLNYELRRAGAYLIGPCPLCGGVDRFTVKRTARGDRWHCRQCGDGRYHDVIDFVKRRDHCDFQTALKTLGQVAPVASWSRLKEPEIKPLELPSMQWQRDAWRHVDIAGDELFNMHYGLEGREYLTARGLTKATAYAWHLGFARVYDPISKCNRPAIVIPWVTESDREITAVKYRFIDDIPNAGRYSYMAGSVPLLFGGWDLPESHTTLLLIEGEINTMSIWQLRPRGLSVVSFGSEPEGEIPTGRAAILRDLAHRYKNIIVWMDEGTRAKQYEKVLARACRKLQSPMMENKLDANQLLIMGELHSFVQKVLGMACMNGEVGSMP